MGSRDFRKRETKKPKKGAKKIAEATIITTPAEVEVVKKAKKVREAGEIEEEEG